MAGRGMSENAHALPPAIDLSSIDELDRSVIVTDASGVITAWNSGATALYGWRPHEVLGKQIFEVIGTGPKEADARAGFEQLAAGRPRAGEFKARHKDGRQLVIDFVNVPITGDDGVLALIGFSSDRTAERTLAEELRASRERLEMTTAQGRVGTWRTNLRTGRTAWDTGLERIFGLEPGSFGGGFEDFLALVHPEDRDSLTATVRDAIERGDEYVLEHRGIVNGEIRWIEGRGRVIRDRDGTPRHTVGVAIDVTERKIAELAVAAQSAHLRELAESLQRRLLQSELPTIRGVDIAARYVPAGEIDVGGDWYDVIDLGAGRVAFAVGDVMGRGVEAASVMGQVRIGLRAYILEQLRPAEALERLGRLVASLDTESFSTLVVGVIDTTASTVTWSTCGHPPLFVRHADGCVESLISAPAPPVGVAGSAPVESTVRISPGDVLVGFSDGLVERRDLPVTAGLQQLAAQLASAPRGPAVGIVDHLLQLAPGSDDDVAVLVVAIGELPPVTDGATELEWEAPPLPVSVRESRRRLEDALLALDVADAHQTAMLVLTELVTNAVLHARTPFVVRVLSREGRLRLEVEDRSGHIPTPAAYSRTAASGRGLRVVDAVTASWGTQPTAGGKMVWAEIERGADQVAVHPFEDGPFEDQS